MRDFHKLLRPITHSKLHFHLILAFCLIRFWIGAAGFLGMALWWGVQIYLTKYFELEATNSFENASLIVFHVSIFLMTIFVALLIALFLFKTFPRLHYARQWLKAVTGLLALSQVANVLHNGEYTIKSTNPQPVAPVAYLVKEESTLLIPAIGFDLLGEGLNVIFGTLQSGDSHLVGYESRGNILLIKDCEQVSRKRSKAIVYRKVPGREPAAEIIRGPAVPGSQLLLVSNNRGVRLVRREVTSYSELKCY